MYKSKSFEDLRAGKLAYVYLSCFNNLIIEEFESDKKFDYIVDISDGNRASGRFFAIEMKDYSNKQFKVDWEEYSNVFIPSLLILFDNKTDKGFYKWLQRPNQGGKLSIDTQDDIQEFTTESLKHIVEEVKEWYMQRHVA